MMFVALSAEKYLSAIEDGQWMFQIKYCAMLSVSQYECLYIFVIFGAAPNFGGSDKYLVCFPYYLYYSYIRWGSLSGKDKMVDIYRLTIRLRVSYTPL